MNKQETETTDSTDNTDKSELSPSVKSVSSVGKNPDNKETTIAKAMFDDGGVEIFTIRPGASTD